MFNLVRLIYILGTGLCMVGAFLITTSLFIADRAPQSNQFLIISLAFSLVLIVVGILLFGIQHHLVRASLLVQSIKGQPSDAMKKNLSRLAICMVLGGIALCLGLALIDYAILARIHQGFAVFG